ncbi:hypothetical protein GCM10008164_15410 [Achromobacter xylosoxidans]|nr:hypothetical protein GCM10008164_15410 [Achromobacter xylosoxidans]
MFLATFTLGENDSPDEKILVSEGSVELPPVGIGAQPAKAAVASDTGKARASNQVERSRDLFMLSPSSLKDPACRNIIQRPQDFVLF